MSGKRYLVTGAGEALVPRIRDYDLRTATDIERAEVFLEEGLRRTVDWYLEHRDPLLAAEDAR